MGIRTAQEQGIQVILVYFLLFLAAHLIIASVGIVLMREKWRNLWMVPIYRIVYEPLRAYLLYTAVYMAVRGVRAGWKKLPAPEPWTSVWSQTSCPCRRRSPSRELLNDDPADGR